MSEWTEAGYTWGEAVERIQAAVKVDRERYGERHGLRGVFALKAVRLVAVGQMRGEVIRLGEDLLGTLGMSQLLGASERSQRSQMVADELLDDAIEAISEMMAETTISGFAQGVSVPVSYQRYEHAGVTATRFFYTDDGVVGPDGQMPVTHHLLAYALGIDGRLDDRNVLRGAW